MPTLSAEIRDWNDRVPAGRVVPARPPDDREDEWTVESRSGLRREKAPRAHATGEEVELDGTVSFVPDAPDAELLVVTGVAEDGEVVAAAVSGDAPGVQVEAVMRYDAAVLAQAIAPFRTPEYRWRELGPGLEDVFIHLMETARGGAA